MSDLELPARLVPRAVLETMQNGSAGRYFLAPAAGDKQKPEMAWAWLARHGDKSEVPGYV